MCLNTEAADHELQIDKFLKLGSLQHEKKKTAYHSLQTDAPQVQTAEAWTVPREDSVSHREEIRAGFPATCLFCFHSSKTGSLSLSQISI